jgi:3-oxoacyl-(acyl-carrier-protein) synthase
VNRDGLRDRGRRRRARLEELEHAKARAPRASIARSPARRDLRRTRHGGPVREGAVRCMRMALARREARRSTTSIRTPPRRPVGDEKEIEADPRGLRGRPTNARRSRRRSPLTGHSLGRDRACRRRSTRFS